MYKFQESIYNFELGFNKLPSHYVQWKNSRVSSCLVLISRNQRNQRHPLLLPSTSLSSILTTTPLSLIFLLLPSFWFMSTRIGTNNVVFPKPQDHRQSSPESPVSHQRTIGSSVAHSSITTSSGLRQLLLLSPDDCFTSLSLFSRLTVARFHLSCSLFWFCYPPCITLNFSISHTQDQWRGCVISAYSRFHLWIDLTLPIWLFLYLAWTLHHTHAPFIVFLLLPDFFSCPMSPHKSWIRVVLIPWFWPSQIRVCHNTFLSWFVS